jgi:hypothetical protein
MGKSILSADQWPAWNVESRATKDLVPYARNSRTHSDEQIAQIAASIKEWGWTIPILIDEQGGIIAGHGRVLAASLLGIETVPVMIARGWSEAKIKAYVIADNKLTLNGGWDESLLALEFADLSDMNFDLSLTGFSAGDIDALLESIDASTDKDGDGVDDTDIEPPAEPVTKIGDVWVLGDHRIMCGSSTDHDDVRILLDGEMPDLVFADPPYGVEVVDAKGTVGNKNKAAKNVYDAIIGDETTDTARDFYRVCLDLGMDDFVLWGGNYFTSFLPPKKCWLIWDKKGRQWDDAYSDFEMAWTSFDKPAKIITHVWMGMIQEGEREKRVHPTQKPVQLAIDCIEFVNPTARVIYDGFSGSGFTLLACEKTGRQALVMELSPKYVDVAIMRWQELTGQRAYHAETGEEFPNG